MSSVASPAEFKPGVPDWSTVHQLTGALASPPSDGQAWRRHEWPEERVQQFHRDGFVSNVPLLTEEQCDRLADEFKCLMDGKHPGIEMMYEYHLISDKDDPHHGLMRGMGQWRLTQLFHDVPFLPQLVVPISQCLGRKAVRFWHDKIFFFPPNFDTFFAWHQDYSYWTHTKPIGHMTIHIALDDNGDKAEAVNYIPGSHRWTRNNGGPLPIMGETFNSKSREGVKPILTEEEKAEFKPVSARLKKGQASFQHCMCVHGGQAHTGSKDRRVLVLVFFADGTYSDSDTEFLKGTGITPKGKKMEGQFHPLVYDPAWSTQ